MLALAKPLPAKRIPALRCTGNRGIYGAAFLHGGVDLWLLAQPVGKQVLKGKRRAYLIFHLARFCNHGAKQGSYIYWIQQN